MSKTAEIPNANDVSGWLDPTMDSVKGTETPKDPNKGYIALLGWSVNAIKAAQKFNRRYVVVAPDWAADFCEANKIPYIPWSFLRLNDRSMEIAETLKSEGVDVAIPLFEAWIHDGEMYWRCPRRPRTTRTSSLTSCRSRLNRWCPSVTHYA